MKFLLYEEEPEEGHEAEKIIEAKDAKDAIAKFERDLNEGTKFEDADVNVVPLCPNCEKPLHTIGWEEGGVLDVNKDGSYTPNGQESSSYVCPNCKQTIGGFGQTDWGFLPDID